MNTQFKLITKTAVWIILILALGFTLGCSEPEKQKEQDNQNSNNTQNVTTVDVPSIDIHAAVISNNIEAIKQHIKAGSDLNQKDPFGGSSPLMSAALFDKNEIAQVLLEAGADINFINNDGSNALHTAAFFCRPEIVQILLDNGIDKTVRNNMGSTAYESVAGAFKDVKPFYDMIGQSLAPFGLVLDDEYLQKTRPIIAEMLK